MTLRQFAVNAVVAALVFMALVPLILYWKLTNQQEA